MPRRSLLTPAERASLLAFPTTDDELIRHYTFSEFDLASIRQRRGNHNRLGFAVQLCYGLRAAIDAVAGVRTPRAPATDDRGLV